MRTQHLSTVRRFAHREAIRELATVVEILRFRPARVRISREFRYGLSVQNASYSEAHFGFAAAQPALS